MKGFRDDFNVDMPSIIELLTSLESRSHAPNTSTGIIEEMKAASVNTTHMYVILFVLLFSRSTDDAFTSVPHYHVVSKRVTGIFGAPLINFFRRILIDDVYRSIGICLLLHLRYRNSDF